MPTLTPPVGFGRIAKSYSRPGATSPQSPLSPASETRVREAIRQYGIASGWHRQDIWGGFLNRLTGETPEMRRKYPEMAFRESSIKSPLLSSIWSVASLDLTVLPASKSSKYDRDIAETYKYALEEADGGIPQTATEILLGGRIRGESLSHFSLRNELQDRGQYRGKRLIHAVKSKPPGSFALRFDQFGNLEDVQDTATQESFRDRLNEFIHYKWLSLEGSHGVSDLRAAVRAFECKDEITKMRKFYLDKMSGGFLHASNVSGTQMDAMRVALAAARSGGFVMTEPGVELRTLDLAMGSEAAFKSACDDYDKEMMTAIGGSHLPYSQGHAGSERGNTKVQREVSSQGEWKMAADLGMILSAKAKVWVDENYAGADYPKVRLGGGIDPGVVKSQLENIALANTMVPVSAAQIYEVSGAQPPNDPADTAPVHPLHPPAGAPAASGGTAPVPGQPPGQSGVVPNAPGKPSPLVEFNAFADGLEGELEAGLAEPGEAQAGIGGAVHAFADDSSKHPHRPAGSPDGGQFAPTGGGSSGASGTRSSRVQAAREAFQKLRRETFAEAKSEAQSHLADEAAARTQVRHHSDSVVATDSADKATAAFNDAYLRLDAMQVEHDEGATPSERHASFGDIQRSAKQALTVLDTVQPGTGDDRLTAGEIAENKGHLEAVVEHVGRARAALQKFVAARREMKAIATGEGGKGGNAAFADGGDAGGDLSAEPLSRTVVHVHNRPSKVTLQMPEQPVFFAAAPVTVEAPVTVQPAPVTNEVTVTPAPVQTTPPPDFDVEVDGPDGKKYRMRRVPREGEEPFAPAFADDPSKHPHKPAGSPGGGQFAPTGGQLVSSGGVSRGVIPDAPRTSIPGHDTFRNRVTPPEQVTGVPKTKKARTELATNLRNAHTEVRNALVQKYGTRDIESVMPPEEKALDSHLFFSTEMIATGRGRDGPVDLGPVEDEHYARHYRNAVKAVDRLRQLAAG